MIKHLAQLTLMGVLLLVGVSLAVAQQTLQPVRLGNFIEVGNDVWMHIIATMDARYKTIENSDLRTRSGIRPSAVIRRTQPSMNKRGTCSMLSCALGWIFGIRKISRFSSCSSISRSSMAT